MYISYVNNIHVCSEPLWLHHDLLMTGLDGLWSSHLALSDVCYGLLRSYVGLQIQGLAPIHFISVPWWFSECELAIVHCCCLGLLIRGSVRSTLYSSFISFSLKDFVLLVGAFKLSFVLGLLCNLDGSLSFNWYSFHVVETLFLCLGWSVFLPLECQKIYDWQQACI